MEFKSRMTEDSLINFVANLLIERGIVQDKQMCKEYLFPTSRNRLNILQLDNIQKAAKTILCHAQQGHKIHIIIDSDVDGFTSAAVLYDYLNNHVRQKYPNFELSYRIPQGKEHGLRSIVQEYLDEVQYDLIVIPDGGSNDAQECKLLKEKGYEVVIIDHHLVETQNPWAIVVNNQISEQYANKDLSGAGMVYKFISLLDEMLGIQAADEYLDLVALGEIADCMDINELENRYLVTAGLKNIQNGLIHELIQQQKYFFDQCAEITPLDVSFYIAPPINAVIRIGTQEDKQQLFQSLICSKDSFSSADKCACCCIKTKARQNRLRDKAVSLIENYCSKMGFNDDKVLILSLDDIPEVDVPSELTGLIATKLASDYSKPVLLGRIDGNGYLRGSIRNCPQSCLPDFSYALKESNLMDFVQGHKNAAGFAVKQTNIYKLKMFLDDFITAQLSLEDELEQSLDCGTSVDAEFWGNSCWLSDTIRDIYEHKDCWNAFNPEPILGIKNIVVPKNGVIKFGKKGNHSKFDYQGVEYVIFNGDICGDEIDCTGRASLNTWGGALKPQIIIDQMYNTDISQMF